MKILILNGSPHLEGNTMAMVDSFIKGAKEAGHEVDLVHVCYKKISACMGCDACHAGEAGSCVIKDDMFEVFPLLNEAEMLVLASPIHYFAYSGQLQSAITRFYATSPAGIPPKLKKSALLLSSAAKNVYEAPLASYKYLTNYLQMEDLGFFVGEGGDNKSSELLEKIYVFAKSLKN